MNTKAIGDLSEAQVLAAFLKIGKVVLVPFGDNQRYDLVTEENGSFLRVQCKTGRLKNGVISAASQSSYAHRGRKKKGYEGEADLFAIYCPETDKVYIVPVDKARTEIHLRVEATKNGQTKGVVWAKDYLLKK